MLLPAVKLTTLCQIKRNQSRVKRNDNSEGGREGGGGQLYLVIQYSTKINLIPCCSMIRLELINLSIILYSTLVIKYLKINCHR